MKLIIFSDIHGNSYALNQFFKQIEKEEYDYLVFCGDIFGYYYNQKEIITQLRNMKKLIWLKGNHDDNFVKLYKGLMEESILIQNYGHSYYNVKNRFSNEEMEYIQALPSKYICESYGKKIGVFHGTPVDILNGRLYPDNIIMNKDVFKNYDIVILGHTHCRMVRYLDDTMIVNPGSLGQPRDGKGYSYAILDTNSYNVEFCNICFDKTALYDQIDFYDKDLLKLKEVLERNEVKE